MKILKHDAIRIGLKLDISEAEWVPIGKGRAPKSLLKGTFTMGGADFHVEAVRVRMRKGTQLAFCEEGENLLCPISEPGGSGPFETIGIGGANYVLIITPYRT